MRPCIVVVINPVRDLVVGFIERREIVVPNALFLEAPEESFDHAILFWRIRGYILLLQAILLYRFMKTLRAKHKAIVRSDHKTMNIGYYTFANERILQGAGRNPRLAGSRESPTDQVSIAAVDHCTQMAPAILLREQMRHVDCPTAIGLRGNAFHAFHSRPYSRKDASSVASNALSRSYEPFCGSKSYGAAFAKSR